MADIDKSLPNDKRPEEVAEEVDVDGDLRDRKRTSRSYRRRRRGYN
jgi:hypothetical protein